MDVFKMDELHGTIREGNFDRVQQLVRDNWSLVEIGDPDDGKTAVSVAIESRNDDIAKWLIRNGCRLSRSERTNDSRLTCNSDIQKIVNTSANGLIQCGNLFAGVTKNDEANELNRGDTQACSSSSVGGSQSKDKPIYHSEPSAPEENVGLFYPPLFAAVSVGSYEMVKLLLESQRAPVEESFRFKTPLVKACIEGYVDIAALLIKFGADVIGHCTNQKMNVHDSKWYHSPLYHAVQNNQAEVIEMLVASGATYIHEVPLQVYSFHGADPYTISHRAYAPLLELGVRQCQPSVVSFLIDSFRSEITDLGRYYALVWSVKYHQAGMTEVLLEKLFPDSYNMEVDECGDKYRQILRIAVRECPQHNETVPLLLLQRFGRSLFPQEEGFHIILHSAVLRRLPQLVTKLLEIAKHPSCNFHVSHYESWPDLCSAALYYGNKQILSALYDNGWLDLSTQSDGENAFFEAIFCERNGASVYEVLSWLVDCGLDPSACDIGMVQPIHTAVTHRLNSAVDALCRLGVDANARIGGDDFHTPLHVQLNSHIAQLGCDFNLDLMKVLVGHGADLAIENGDGHTPVTILFRMLYDSIHQQEAAARRATDDPHDAATPPYPSQGAGVSQGLNQGANTRGRTSNTFASISAATDTVILPTHLQPGCYWRDFIEMLVDRFGVNLISMGATRRLVPEEWVKVHASLVHAGIDMGHVPALRTMCWVRIRRQLGGVRFCEKLNQLPLPEITKTYLKSL
ncbi:hypothetical protein BaRGS_00023721 [Batillaria attramentaria]|uniref:SOCS box domain-containing protein n=1 Tax=Batillaria attramentaria TaxID=370345 RepID=A0ABD0KDG1_9CAEN